MVGKKGVARKVIAVEDQTPLSRSRRFWGVVRLYARKEDG